MSLQEIFKALNTMRLHSYSHWLAMLANLCTTNCSPVLARERWQNIENSWTKNCVFSCVPEWTPCSLAQSKLLLELLLLGERGEGNRKYTAEKILYTCLPLRRDYGPPCTIHIPPRENKLIVWPHFNPVSHAFDSFEFRILFKILGMKSSWMCGARGKCVQHSFETVTGFPIKYTRFSKL